MNVPIPILFVAATTMEMKFFKSWWDDHAHAYPNIRLSFLVTGIGMSWTVFNLTKRILEEEYQYVVQIGIGGAYNRDLEIGSVVAVLTEVHGDLGFEELDGSVTPLEEFSGMNDRIITNKQLNKEFTFEIPKVIGVTVDTTTGKLDTAERRKWQYNADVETMEGFALHLVASQLEVPYLQIRSISNFVEQRDTKRWDVKLALKSLNQFLTEEFIPSL